MAITNAEGMAQRGAMAAKVYCNIAVLQGLFFFFFTLGGGGGCLRLSKLLEFQTMYLGMIIIPFIFARE